MVATAIEAQLTTIRCPLCGDAAFAVERLAAYSADISIEEYKTAFRASSDHSLLDQLVRCESCNLVYVNPRISDDVLLSGYINAVDADFVAQNPERIKTFTRMLNGILPRLGFATPNGKRILDVGCAGGAFLIAAKKCGLEPVGVEPSKWLAEYAGSKYGLDVHQGVLTYGRFPACSFDIVSLWDVIEHVSDPAGLLNTIHSTLKPSGVLIVNFPDYGSWAAKLLAKKWPFLLSVHLLYYTRATMREQLERSGFEVIDVRPHYQSLPLGYVLRRMSPYFGFADHLRRIAEKLGLAGVPFYYNMGQTLVVARKIA
jgi:2-polyprenyl-3-methyl-5-hydroxy-6-metoxy-1,4-benzoquinol methylase